MGRGEWEMRKRKCERLELEVLRSLVILAFQGGSHSKAGQSSK